MSQKFLKQTWELVGQFLRPHKTVLIISSVLSVISTALGMIQPLFVKVLIDRILLGQNYHFLVIFLIAVIALLTLGFIIRVANSYIYTKFSAQVLFTMREALFGHLQKVPLHFFTHHKIGDIHSRIASDMSDIQELLTKTLPDYFFNIITCCITVGILIWLNWQMALMSFAAIPIALYIIYRIQPKLVILARHMAENNADISHFLFEALSGIREIRAFSAERVENQRLQEKHAGLLSLLMRYQTIGIFSRSIPMIYRIINTLVVFGYGGFLVMHQSLTIGSLVAFSIYQGRVFEPLRSLIDGFLAMQKSRASMDRVQEILDIPPTVDQETITPLPDAGEPFQKTIQGHLHFDQVNFSYDQKQAVLKHVSFHIPASKVTAIVGPSGVGKSTVCHLILRFFDPDSGKITLDGRDLREYPVSWLRGHITLVSQDTFLFHTTIMDNIRFSRPKASDTEVIQAAEAAHIHSFIENLPQGYQTMVGDRGVRLSGGQKQRLSIARAILTKPQILILDEATAFLDSSVENRFRQSLHSLMPGRTIIVISHRDSSLQGTDKIIALNKLGVVYEGPSERYFHLRTSGDKPPQFSDTILGSSQGL
jgi:ABC-type bacteriocin/lantibiotic exporter with double-glycine peptidase domain